VKTPEEAYRISAFSSRLTFARVPANFQISEKARQAIALEDENLQVESYIRILFLSFVLFWFALFVLLLVVTPSLWCQAQVPSELPWSNQMTSLVINTLTTMPLMCFFSMSTLRLLSGELGKKKKAIDGTIEHSFFGPRWVTPAMATWLIFVQVVSTMVVGMVVYSVVLWLPSFVLDIILSHYNVSSTNIDSYNALLNIFIFYVLFKKVPAWTAQYDKAKQRAEELRLQQQKEIRLEEPLIY